MSNWHGGIDFKCANICMAVRASEMRGVAQRNALWQ